VIAALFVASGGVYYDQELTDVDQWDEMRDARKYAGPYPVVAHPPCARWCSLAGFVQHVYGYRIGDDGGCFASALASVRKWGGVLEHPAHSIAWRHFDLPVPERGRWLRWLTDPGWVTEVSQVAYGNRARKRTWLYYIGSVAPPPMDWSEPYAPMVVGSCTMTSEGKRLRRNHKRLSGIESSSSPVQFRDALLDMARGAHGGAK
jgi:hypothetical protein